MPSSLSRIRKTLVLTGLPSPAVLATFELPCPTSHTALLDPASAPAVRSYRGLWVFKMITRRWRWLKGEPGMSCLLRIKTWWLPLERPPAS